MQEFMSMVVESFDGKGPLSSLVFICGRLQNADNL